MGVLVNRFLSVCSTVCAAGLAAPAAAGSGDDIYRDGYEAPGGGAVPACAPVAPQFPPAGYSQGYSPTLRQLWFETTGEDIGGALAKVRLEGGTFAAMSFTRAMFNPDATIFTFNADTSNVGTGLQGADHRWVTISECPGDLRVADDTSPDPTRRSACRVSIGSEGPFMYVNWGPPIANPAFCNLDPAKTYYFNVVFDNPADGFNAATPCSQNGGLNQCGYRMAVQ